MRLPYIQIAMEVIEQAAPDVAVDLDADEAAIGWGLVKVVRWALGRCPDYLPPSASALVVGPHAAKQIARAAGWAGDPDAFVDAVARVQPAPMLERLEGSIRIRGLDRYDAAWGKSHPDLWKKWKANHPDATGAEPEQNRAGTGPEPGRSGVGTASVSGLQTQTQTQTQKEATAPPACANGPVGELRDGIDAEFKAQRGAAYEWTFEDERQLKGKIHHGTAEILRRWNIALRRTRFPTCSTVRDLCQRWNDYAAEEAQPAPPRRNDVRRGVARAEDADHSKNRVLADGTIDL